MVYPTKCIWGCRKCLSLFWRICSTTGLPREPFLVALPREWSHCWRKVISMFWEELEDDRPISLLNIELQILARVLVNRSQLIISDLIGPEQNYAVKGRSIQDNLFLVRQIREGIEEDTEAALINLDQSKAFNRVDHRFLATVLETAGFKPEFHKWISIMYHNPQAVVLVNGRRSGTFAIERSVRQSCPLSPLLYIIAVEPLLRRLIDERVRPALRAIPLAGRIRPKVSAYDDDITVSVSRHMDIRKGSSWMLGGEPFPY